MEPYGLHSKSSARQAAIDFGIAVTAADITAIAMVNQAAFGRPDEALLVDALRAAGVLALSLVALADDEVVGHIAFSPVTIAVARATVTAIGLAPMAVTPASQRRGVGVRLIGESFDRLRAAGHQVVVVFGHPSYYARFGFARRAASACAGSIRPPPMKPSWPSSWSLAPPRRRRHRPHPPNSRRSRSLFGCAAGCRPIAAVWGLAASLGRTSSAGCAMEYHPRELVSCAP